MAERALALDEYMTVDEFLRRPDDIDGTKYELVDGILRAMSPATVKHGAIQARVTSLLANHLRSAGTRCHAITEPAVKIALRSHENRRIPDIGVTCTSFDDKAIDLPEPILLVEILSPGNRHQTMENVRAYTTIPSVREILIVNSVGFGVMLLRRNEDGSWPPDFQELASSDELHLHSIDLKQPANALYP